LEKNDTKSFATQKKTIDYCY